VAERISAVEVARVPSTPAESAGPAMEDCTQSIAAATAKMMAPTKSRARFGFL
jgi:hypothetical protein